MKTPLRYLLTKRAKIRKQIKQGFCCLRCGRVRARSTKMCVSCRRYQRKHRTKRKIFILTHYGKGGELKCCWRNCQIVDPDMLTIDHIDDNGAKDRATVGSGSAMYSYLTGREFPEGFQTLCMNHQFKKQILKYKIKIQNRRKPHDRN